MACAQAGPLGKRLHGEARVEIFAHPRQKTAEAAIGRLEFEQGRELRLPTTTAH